MRKQRSLIGFMACLLFPLNMGAEELTDHLADTASQAVDSISQRHDDYIKASLLVVAPSSEVYSLFGHCALRLQCPSHQMDYCFTFETATDTWGKLNFFRGSTMGGLTPAPTSDYLDYYRQAGRSVTAYDLNLTPTEKLHLWQRTDEMVASGFVYSYSYMHAQCTSMLIKLITSVLDTPVNYQELPRQLGGSFRDQMLTESAPYPWSRFFWQSIMGAAGDDTSPLEHKITPRLLPQVWQNALVGNTDRKLINSEGTMLVDAAPEDQSPWQGCTPTAVFAVLLAVAIVLTLAQWRGRCKRTVTLFDGMLLVLHTIISLGLTWMSLFSQQEAAAWNYYVLAFNPLPLLLWFILPRWHRAICLTYVAILTVFLVSGFFIPQADLPHALFVATIAMRVAARGLTIKENTQQNDN